MALSPDYSGPPLAATLSYGVRTFLSLLPLFTAAGSDRLIRFSPTFLSMVISFFYLSFIGFTSKQSVEKPCSQAGQKGPRCEAREESTRVGVLKQYVRATPMEAEMIPARLSATILNACLGQAGGRWAFFNGL